ncbi:MAG: response regulator [Vulcanimicrobiaceae bacterium]
MQIGVEISRALENKRIFVIDSDEITRAAIQFMLQDENETHELASVAEAIERSGRRKVDLIVIGEALVRERGPAVFDEIAQGIPGAKVLLLVDSARDAHDHRQFGLAGVLAKPLTVESVRHKVNAVLGRGFTPLQILS